MPSWKLAPVSPLQRRSLVTDAKGIATCRHPAPTARDGMNGHVASTLRIPLDNRSGTVLRLLPGYRAVVNVELPPASGPLLVRVLNTAGQTMDARLDGVSDRGIEPPGRLSLGPLPPGDYVIQLHGAREDRQERITIVDRDVVATFR